VSAIVDECWRAVAWIAHEGAHGRTSPRVAGHWRRHLLAMLFATDWAVAGPAPAAGGVSLSGVHDLAPMVVLVQRRLQARRCRGARLSPFPRCAFAAPLLAVGADETSEFIRQTRPVGRVARQLAAGWQAPLIVPDATI
jgi:hypothetical protein